MKEPDFILKRGTRVVVHEAIQVPIGFLVNQKYVDARCPRAKGVIQGFVPGHGGDAYWVMHDDGAVAVYSWQEFELEEEFKQKPTGMKGALISLAAVTISCPYCKTPQASPSEGADDRWTMKEARELADRAFRCAFCDERFYFSSFDLPRGTI